MILGKVVGRVVNSQQNVSIEGPRFLLIEKCNQKGQGRNDYIVALDLVSAGYDELVMIAESSSARQTPETNNKPVDAIIVGIVDVIDENEAIVYKK
jgi:microcompartment protein CcmK/EutM